MKIFKIFSSLNRLHFWFKLNLEESINYKVNLECVFFKKKPPLKNVRKKKLIFLFFLESPRNIVFFSQESEAKNSFEKVNGLKETLIGSSSSSSGQVDAVWVFLKKKETLFFKFKKLTTHMFSQLNFFVRCQSCQIAVFQLNQRNLWEKWVISLYFVFWRCFDCILFFIFGSQMWHAQ